MKVSTLIHDEVVICRATDYADVAAQLMLEHNVGCLPVIDDEGHVSGMVTDRDLCMAAYTQALPLRAIPVALAMSRHVFACKPDDSLADVERMMRERKIRRVPVVDAENHPIGIVSLTDIARVSP